MDAINCKRCKGRGWLKWYKRKNGKPGFASDTILHLYLGKRITKYLPVCPCTLQGIRHKPKTSEVYVDGFEQRENEYNRFQRGELAAKIAAEYNFTLEQMQIRISWFAMYTGKFVRDNYIVHGYKHTDGMKYYCDYRDIL